MRLPSADAPVDDCAFGILTIVPPAVGGENLARDLVLLLDVSGSMDGRPLQDLKTIGATLIDNLEDNEPPWK